jgi:hypothetical protein
VVCISGMGPKAQWTADEPRLLNRHDITREGSALPVVAFALQPFVQDE